MKNRSFNVDKFVLSCESFLNRTEQGEFIHLNAWISFICYSDFIMCLFGAWMGSEGSWKYWGQFLENLETLEAFSVWENSIAWRCWHHKSNFCLCYQIWTDQDSFHWCPVCFPHRSEGNNSIGIYLIHHVRTDISWRWGMWTRFSTSIDSI